MYIYLLTYLLFYPSKRIFKMRQHKQQQTITHLAFSPVSFSPSAAYT